MDGVVVAAVSRSRSRRPLSRAGTHDRAPAPRWRRRGAADGGDSRAPGRASRARPAYPRWHPDQAWPRSAKQGEVDCAGERLGADVGRMQAITSGFPRPMSLIPSSTITYLTPAPPPPAVRSRAAGAARDRRNDRQDQTRAPTTSEDVEIGRRLLSHRTRLLAREGMRRIPPTSNAPCAMDRSIPPRSAACDECAERRRSVVRNGFRSGISSMDRLAGVAEWQTRRTQNPVPFGG